MTADGGYSRPVITLDELDALRRARTEHAGRLDALADRLDRLTVALKALAEATGHEINLPLGANVTNLFDRPDLAERVAGAGDDAEVIGRG